MSSCPATDSLNVRMSVSTLRAWLHPTTLPPNGTQKKHIHKPLSPFLLFEPPLTQSGPQTSVSPVGMVPLSSPSQVTLVRPNALLRAFFVVVCCMYVCKRMLIWHSSKLRGTVTLPSSHLAVCEFSCSFSSPVLCSSSFQLSRKDFSNVAIEESSSGEHIHKILECNVCICEFVHMCVQKTLYVCMRIDSR